MTDALMNADSYTLRLRFTIREANRTLPHITGRDSTNVSIWETRSPAGRIRATRGNSLERGTSQQIAFVGKSHELQDEFLSIFFRFFLLLQTPLETDWSEDRRERLVLDGPLETACSKVDTNRSHGFSWKTSSLSRFLCPSIVSAFSEGKVTKQDE